MNPPFQAVNVDCNFDYAYERERLSAAGITLVTQKSVSEEDIIAACTGADVVVVEGARTPITERVIQALPRCR
jgi:phosphoglycerate dehydrogenase-like enzyme